MTNLFCNTLFALVITTLMVAISVALGCKILQVMFENIICLLFSNAIDF